MRYYLAIDESGDGVAIEASATRQKAHEKLREWAKTIPTHEWDGLLVEQRNIDKLDKIAFVKAVNSSTMVRSAQPGKLMRLWRMTQRGGLKEKELRP